MDQTTIASLDADLRKAALAHSTHDLRGGAKPAEVVERAQAYYDFLKGALLGGPR